MKQKINKAKHTGQPREKDIIGEMGGAFTQLNQFSMAVGNGFVFNVSNTWIILWRRKTAKQSKNYVTHRGDTRYEGSHQSERDILDIL